MKGRSKVGPQLLDWWAGRRMTIIGERAPDQQLLKEMFHQDRRSKPRQNVSVMTINTVINLTNKSMFLKEDLKKSKLGVL